MPAAKDPRYHGYRNPGGRMAVVVARVPTWMKFEAERQAAHELKSVAGYVRQALQEKVLRGIDAEKDDDTTRDRG